MKHYKRVLTIAGSDPSGGAGIQADIKTFAALGCYGASAIVAVVDENTVGVSGVHPVPVDFVKGQIRSVLSDIGADAIKIGMLHSAELILAVRDTLAEFPEISNIVLDPVMVATSGDNLLQNEAVTTLRDELIPYSRVITPNIPEAEVLLGASRIAGQHDLPLVIRELSFGRRVSVLLKAGHLKAEMLTDVFYNAETDEIIELTSPHVNTVNTHGTGCTLSSAIAAFLAHGLPLNDAVKRGKDYLFAALQSGADYQIGKGHGPVNHFYGVSTLAVVLNPASGFAFRYL
ncbi:MAG: bifunctional hydroxymethylpyrimidine kinase/phosphomethylpyrimidine kinase [Tannerella sp.]|jgi:hydroxymethylpyrimidine/phosphomethylpyrimidine kinase|nr:bifunctional hydroxymethylpyrimidine kinase/phosphomethylpyrimidine kinase [Tannerella sp.]